MNRERSLIDIREMLARFKAEVEIANKANLYDANIIAESILIPFLNEVFELSLININLIERNYPAVDLVDEVNRVAIQVTSTPDRDKIIHTLSQFRDKKLDAKYDKLYIYILSEKRDYSKDFNEYLPSNFSFNKDSDIIDSSIIFKIIVGINNLYRIEKIADHLKDEFSDRKIEIRKRLHIKEKQEESEPIILNMVGIKLPLKIYSATVNIDKNEFKNKIRKKRFTFFEKEIVVQALSSKQIKDIQQDWTIHKGVLYTFRDLYHENEPLREVIDLGTIQIDNTTDFTNISENHENILKGLIKFVLINQFSESGLEWLQNEGIFRFKVKGIAKATSVTWKKEVKNAPRDVISEHWNKEKTHIVAFRHLSFTHKIYHFSDNWYLCIKPTWSFTWDGKHKSRFSDTLISGLKLLETNQTVYGHFLFLSDYIKDKPILNLNQEYRFINILEPIIFNFSPIVDEDVWNPVRPKVKTEKIELNQGFLFTDVD